MENTLDKIKEVCNELLDSPGEKSVTNFSGYVRQELASGHIAQLSTCFKSVTDALIKLSETDNSTLNQLFELDFHFIIPFKVFAVVLDHDVVCTPDAEELLLSLIGFLNAACENTTIGKTKLAVLIPVLLHDILLNEERGIHLRIETIKVTNLILGDVVSDGVDPTDQIGMAFKELERKMEHVLVTAGDIELQAGLVELIIRLIPYDIRQRNAQEYFSNNSVSQAFTDILNVEFEAGCRTFLNTLNRTQTENQSVVSFPCYSANFGTEEVHKPVDDKIKDFWVDFNFGSKSFSLFVEEQDKEGNDKEGGSWETVLIKADMVEDYRLAGINNGDIALLLKLKCPASDLVTFLPYDHSQYIKIVFSGYFTPICTSPVVEPRKYKATLCSDTSGLTSVLATIFGLERKVQNTGGDSDASSTPSKASVAINPVHIRSKNIEMACVMPTASIMLQLSESTTDHEEEKGQEEHACISIIGKGQKTDRNSIEDIQGIDFTSDKDEADYEAGGNLGDKQTTIVNGSKKRQMQDEPLTRREDKRPEQESKKHNAHATKPVKRTSERIQSQTKRQSVQHRLQKIIKPKEGKNRKSLPSAFNVSSRLAASKRKSTPTKTLSEAAKSRKAIREKVFAKASCFSPRVKSIQEFKENDTKLHLVTPARRREPRSGKRRSGKYTPLPVKGYKQRKADKPKSAFSSSSSNVFSEASDVSCYNQGGVSSNRTTDDTEDNRGECTDIIQDSLPLADSMEEKSEPKRQGVTDSYKRSSVLKKKVTGRRQSTEPDLESVAKTRKRTNVPSEKTSERRSAEVKRKTADKRDLPGVKGRQQKHTDPSALNEPKVSSFLSESKRRPTNKGTTQSAKRKHQKQEETLTVVEPQVSSSETEDMPENQNEPVLKESTRRPTHKKTSQSAKRKNREHIETLSVVEPQVGSSEMEDMPENQNEPVLQESKRRPTSKKTSKGEKGKYQKQIETSFKVEPEVVSSSESEGIPENQKDPVLKESNRRTTNKKALRNMQGKQQKQKELLPKDAPEVGDLEMEDIYDDQNEPVLEVNDGSDDEVTEWYAGNETECYVEDASPLINSPPIPQASSRTRRQRPVNVDCSTRRSDLDVSESKAKPRVKRPVTKEKKQTDNHMRSTPRTRPHKHEFGVHMEKTPQAQQSGEEKSESSEEEEIPLKRAKITPKLTPRGLSQQTEVSYAAGQEDEKDDTQEESDSVHSDPELDYDFNVDRTPHYKANQNRQDKRQLGFSSGGSNSAKRSMVLNDSGIGETPFGEETQKRLKFSRKRSWKPLQVSITKTPITPKSDKEEQEEDNSVDAETDEEYVSPHMSPEKQTMDKRQRGRRAFVDWSTSGPSTSRGPSVQGTRTLRTEAGWYKEPLHVSEANVSYRKQHFVKPRKLSYDDKPYDIEETEEVISENSEDVRREIESLVNIAGTEVLKANRRTCQMINSYAQRANEVMLSTVDTFWNEHQAASFNAMSKYKSQLRDQTRSLEEDLDKTASTVREMENTFAKHFKILKSQRQVDDKRFKKIQHLQTLMENELTKMEGRRNEQETTLRAEMEKETLKFQKKFLQDTRKQKEDQLKMVLNILRIL